MESTLSKNNFAPALVNLDSSPYAVSIYALSLESK